MPKDVIPQKRFSFLIKAENAQALSVIRGVTLVYACFGMA